MRPAAALIALISLWLLFFPVEATTAIGAVTSGFLDYLGLPVLWLSSAFLLMSAVLTLGPWGRIRLGAPDDRPEFGTFSWLAMLFAAGMGSGLMFWGVAEPLTHLRNPPIPGLDPAEQAISAMAVTWFHWGFHAWAIYAVSGLFIAWFSFRHGARETPSGVLDSGLSGWLQPPLRRRLGTVADVIAVAAVVFGVAGALANSTLLLHHGLGQASQSTWPTFTGHALILGAMGIGFLASAHSGIYRGIRWLSLISFYLSVLLLLIVVFNADLLAIANISWRSLVRYLAILPGWSFQRAEVGGGFGWSSGWTITYLLWWMAWAPFVGMFIARISRGRTIRAYMLGVIGMPVLFSIVWFAVLGGGALAYDSAHDGELSQALARDYTEPLFVWFASMGEGLRTALSYLTCALLFIFIVSSADSATYVMGIISEKGNPNPAARTKFLWGILTLALATGLLLRRSADVNKAIAIAGAIPYVFLLLLQAIAWGRSFAASILIRWPGTCSPP